MIFVSLASLIFLLIILADWRIYRFIENDAGYVKLDPISKTVKELENIDVTIFVHKDDKDQENAFTGGIYKKFIVLSLPMFTDTSNEVLEAVLTHEVGHIRKHHPLQRIISMSLISTVVLMLSFDHPYIALIILFACLFQRKAINKVLTPIFDEIYLYQEYQADQYACSRGYTKEILEFLGDKAGHPIHALRIKKIFNNAKKKL